MLGSSTSPLNTGESQPDGVPVTWFVHSVKAHLKSNHSACATAGDVTPWKMPFVLHGSGGENAESRVARLGGASGVKREGDAKPMLRKAVVLDAPRGRGGECRPGFFLRGARDSQFVS